MIIKKQVEPGSSFTFGINIPEHCVRLDVFLTHMFTRYSRSFFKRLIEERLVLVNNKPGKSGQELRVGDIVLASFPRRPETRELKTFDHETGVKIVAQHDDFLIIYKPAGLMVHKPSAFCQDVTLADWLVATFPELEAVGVQDRPGIVHRLDKDTSGLIIVTRNIPAHTEFGNLFRTRQIHKTYWALVCGHPPKSGSIDFSIGRDPVHKHRMAHSPKYSCARSALTHYTTVALYEKYALLSLNLITGRTHQIRVHCAAIGHPVLGDAVYGTPSPLITRQALHAKSIAFTYQGNYYEFDWPVPEDMAKLISSPTI